MTGSTAETEIFEQHRRHLTGAAYRITGSWTDAEDIAQDVWLRWVNAHPAVDKPRNWPAEGDGPRVVGSTPPAQATARDLPRALAPGTGQSGTGS